MSLNETNLSKGYLLTKGIFITDDGNYPIEIVPIWDKRITYENDSDYGPSYLFNGKREELRDVLLKVNTKELFLGIELNVYPELEFSVGETVFAKVGAAIYKSSIKEIIYNDYSLGIYKGKDIKEYYRVERHFPTLTVEPDALYYIKDWYAHYLLEDGRLIEWKHDLYKEFKA